MMGVSLLPLVATSGLAQVPQSRIVAPSEIVIHVQKDITDLTFLPFVGTRLADALKPPIRMVRTSFDPAPVRPGRGLIDATALLGAFAQTIEPNVVPGSMHVLIVGDDIRLPPARFNFAVSMGGPETSYRLMTISLARLMTWERGRADDLDPEQTALRVARLIIKNTAWLSGLNGSDRCVMAFPNTLRALDEMPTYYCEPDLSALVAAGVARSGPATR